MHDAAICHLCNTAQLSALVSVYYSNPVTRVFSQISSGEKKSSVRRISCKSITKVLEEGLASFA